MLHIIRVGFTGLLVSALVSCGALSSEDAGDTTCEEFASMAPNTGLDSALTSEQQDALTDMLEEANAVPGRELQASFQVIPYCNITGGHAGSHADEPIKNIPGLQG